MISSSPRVLRLISYAFCLITVFSAAAALAIGSWYTSQDDRKAIIDLTESSVLERTSHYLIFLSLLYSFLTFIFLVGILNDSKPLLLLYSFFNGLFLVISCGFLISISVYIIVTNNYLRDVLYSSLEDSFESVSSKTSVSKSWNLIQVLFGCCGVESSSDWQKSDWFGSRESNITVYGTEFKSDFPFSCCYHVDSDEWLEIDDRLLAACYAPQPSNYVAANGCYEPLKDFLSENILLIFGYLMYMFFIAIIGQVLALLFACVNWKENR